MTPREAQVTPNAEEASDKHLAALRLGGIQGVGAHLVGRGARLLYELVLSRTLGPAGLGVFALAVSVFDIGRTVAYLGLDHAVVRYVAIFDAAGDKAKITRVLRIAFGTGIVSAGLVGLALVATADRLARGVFHMSGLGFGLQMAGLALLPNVVLILSAAAVRARRRILLERVVQAVLPPLLLAALVGTAVGVTGSLLAGFIAFAIAHWVSAIVAFSAMWFTFGDLRRIGDRWRARGVGRDLVGFSSPMLAVTVLYLLLIEGGRLLLGALGSAESVGIYSVGQRVAVQIAVFYVAFDSILAPLLASLSQRRDRVHLEETVQTASYWITALTIPLVLVCTLTPSLITSIFGPEFRASGPVLVILAAGQLLLVGVGPTGRLLQMVGKPHLDALNMVAAVLLMIGLGVWLVPDHGAVGAAIATAGGIATMNALQYAEVRFLLGIRPIAARVVRVVGAGVAAYAVGGVLIWISGATWWNAAAVWCAALGMYAILILQMEGIAHWRELRGIVEAIRSE